MTQFFDLMVDVEFLGDADREDAALVSIGAVFFDLQTCTLGPTFNQTIHLATAVRDGGTLHAATVMFWLGQSQQARDAIRFGGRDIRLVLEDFEAFIREHCRVEDVRPWGNSARCDLGKVGSAYRRAGMTPPWYFGRERCFRTVRNLYPQVPYDYESKGDAAHTALGDAIFQAEHLFAIKNRNKTHA